MLWAKKLEECQAALALELKKFLAPRLKDVNVNDVAADLVKTAVKVDMSRSATRLRRRLYAQWGKYDLCEGEFVRLSNTGLEVRPDLLQRDPDEVGDLHLDPFRIIGVAKMIGLGGKARLSHPDRVRAVHLILSALLRMTRSRKPAPSLRTVAVFMALHAVEANHEVAKSSGLAVVNRHLTQWEVPAVSEAELAAELLLLEEHGAINGQTDPKMWKLCERLSYPW
jgi:hypothetical protein